MVKDWPEFTIDVDALASQQKLQGGRLAHSGGQMQQAQALRPRINGRLALQMTQICDKMRKCTHVPVCSP